MTTPKPKKMPGKFGRLAPYPEDVKPRLKLGKYLTLPTPPTEADWYSKVTSWPMYLNDQLGDCTCAEVGHHIESVSTYGLGNTITVTDSDVLSLYEAVGHYDPTNPSSDQGAVIQDVLGYWRSYGIAGHKCDAFAQVAVANHIEVQQAIYLFGGISIGINVPQSAIDQFNAGKPWDVVLHDGGIAGGHCVEGVGYRYTSAVATDPTGVWLVTWGAVTHMTWAFWDKYVEEAWIVILPEWLDTAGQDPEGIDLYALGEDLSTLTGEPNPFPAPQPTPTPTPTPPPAGGGCVVAALGGLLVVGSIALIGAAIAQ